MNLRQAYFTLPSVIGFVQQLEEQLIDGRNLAVIVPPWISEPMLWGALCDRFWARDLSTDAIDLAAIDSAEDTPPAVLLGDWLGVSWPSKASRPTVEKLIEACRASGPSPPTILLLKGWDRLTSERRERWAAFLGEWAQELRSVRDDIDLTLCAIIVGDGLPAALPVPDVLIETYWWWGFPSALELQVLCRLVDDTSEAPGIRRWREIIVPSLTGGDLRLIERLWDTFDASCADLYAELLAFAAELGWDAAQLSDAHRLLRQLAALSSVPADGYDLWRTGATCKLPEFGVELHAAAAAVVSGELDVRRRLWRGQSPHLLPMIDIVRHHVCHEITARHGEGWALRWRQPRNDWELVALQETSMSCELNYLRWLLQSCDELSPERRRWESLVSHTTWLRNRIAHHHPVTYNDVTRLTALAVRADLHLPGLGW